MREVIIPCPACACADSITVEYSDTPDYSTSRRHPTVVIDTAKAQPCAECGYQLSEDEAYKHADRDLEALLEWADDDPYGGDGPDD